MTIAVARKLLPIHYHNVINQRICYQALRFQSDVESEYTDTPQYPPIEDASWEGQWRKKKVDWHEKIKRLPTIEQKLVELNMPKFYGYFSTLLEEKFFRPFSLDFLKKVTRTKVISTFPTHYYESEKLATDMAVSSIKDKVSELIVLHFGHQISREKRPYKSLAKRERKADEIHYHNFLTDLNNLLLKSFKDEIPHLSSTSVDKNPRIQSSWFVGGFKAAPFVRAIRASQPLQKCIANEPADRVMRGTVIPTLVLRTNQGLPEVVPLDSTGFIPLKNDNQENIIPSTKEMQENNVPATKESLESSNPFSVSLYDSDPLTWGFISRRRRAVSIPGFWPGVKDEYGHIFLHSREYIKQLMKLYPQNNQGFYSIFLEQKAVLAAFTQALAYAFYQGFTPVNELTYPLVQQYISTDGHLWQFGLYQFNTCALHSKFSNENPRMNLLWLSDDMKLFDAIEGDTVKGLNEEVLKLLVSMYLKKGSPRENSNPYLGEYKYLMDHDAPEEYKEEFHKVFHYLTSGRSSARRIPEIYPWELIYKVLFKTRPGDRKMKFFENRWALNPFTRRLDDYKVPYIPKLRRINMKINYQPRLNSECLFKHDFRTMKRASPIAPDDEIAFKTMNIRKDTHPYYYGIKWSRGRIPSTTKI